MRRLTSLVNEFRQNCDLTHADIHRSDHEVVSVAVIEGVVGVAFDALLLAVPLFLKLADGALGQQREIPADEARVFAGQLHFPVEAEVIADEHLRTGDESGGKAFVVAVAQPKHERVVAGRAGGGDLVEAEVSVTRMAKCVGLVDDGEVNSR